MKRFTALVLSAVLAAGLAVPVFAEDVYETEAYLYEENETGCCTEEHGIYEISEIIDEPVYDEIQNEISADAEMIPEQDMEIPSEIIPETDMEIPSEIIPEKETVSEESTLTESGEISETAEQTEETEFSEEETTDEEAELEVAALYGAVTDSVYWEISDEGVLTISGSGSIPDYSVSQQIPWFDYREYVGSIVVEEGITGIGSMAFYCCTYAETAHIASTVTYIGTGAFRETYYLRSVTGMDNVVSFGGFVFEHSGLTSFTFPASTRTIGEYPFYETGSLTQIGIPAGVTSIDYGIGYSAYALQRIDVDPANPYYTSADGVLFDKGMTALIAYPSAKADTVYSIPSSVSVIMPDAFRCQSYLIGINIPSSVTTIGTDAFYGMVSLQSAVIPSSVTSTGQGLFAGCSSLRYAEFQASVNETGRLLFGSCPSLTVVILGGSITTITSDTFEDCVSLGYMVLPSNLVTIESNAFSGCSSLSYIDYPTTLETIGAGAFTGTAVTQFPSWLTQNSSGGYVKGSVFSYSGTYRYDLAYQLLTEINGIRASQGQNPLAMDRELLNAAAVRAGEIVFLCDTVRPDGSSRYSVSELSEGEVIAAGYSTPSEVILSWSRDIESYSRIVSWYYTSAGVSCFCVDGVYYWAVIFGTTAPQSFNMPDNTDTIFNVNAASSVLASSDLVLRCGDGMVQIGTDALVKAYVHRDNAIDVPINGSSVSWSSDNESVLTVSGNGTVTALAAGTATITATAGSLTSSVTLTVYCGHSYEYKGIADNGKARFSCSVCGNTTEAKMPTGALYYWKNSTDQSENYSSIIPVDNPSGSDLQFYLKSMNGDSITNRIKLRSSDPSVLTVPETVYPGEIVNLHVAGAGIVTVTVYSEFNPELENEFLVFAGTGFIDAEDLEISVSTISCRYLGVYSPSVSIKYNGLELNAGNLKLCDTSVEIDEDGRGFVIISGRCAVAGTRRCEIIQTHFGRNVGGRAATCTEPGLTNGQECMYCGAVMREREVIPALGHTEITVPGRPATAEEPGLTDGKKCSVCGAVIIAQQTIPAFGHTWNTGVVTTASTCTAAGTVKYTCTDTGCGAYYTETIPAKGHTEVIISGKAATCTEAGLTDGKKCSECGTVITARQTIPTLGHIWNAGVVTKEATCTAAGVKTCTCTRCNGTYTENIPAKGHTEVIISGK
ncbi:MAG: leucine-rich repeat protein, partial [Parasporobacterium sp.]|nr:leucine-rich repeat protein [Parasporobacterium sp.]